MKLSRNLRVVVVREGNEVVNLTMPVYSVTIIDTLMPESVHAVLEQRGINLIEMKTKLEIENYAPQTLFELETSEKSYRVWIE